MRYNLKLFSTDCSSTAIAYVNVYNSRHSRTARDSVLPGCKRELAMTEIHIITPANRGLYENVIEQSFRLRYDIFVRELGWSALQRADGRDVDAYDQPDTVYILAIDGDRVVGGERLCPTTRPHLLSDVFPYLAHVKGVPAGPDVWECSRYFVIKERRSGRTDCRLLAALQEFGLQEGVSQLSVVVETWWLPRFQDAGFKI